jgi:hypothetical protein
MGLLSATNPYAAYCNDWAICGFRFAVAEFMTAEHGAGCLNCPIGQPRLEMITLARPSACSLSEGTDDPFLI